MNIIIAGIHTGIGKTICSATICQKLGFDYWKAVQAGDLENSDSVFIKNNVRNPSCKIHEERYKLVTPVSPHYAAELENLQIKRGDFKLPETDNNLLVETAGGLMSPLAEGFLIIDLIEELKLPVVLVSNNYLGSINHTLLSVAALEQRKINILGIVFSGQNNPASEEYILNHTKVPLLFKIPTLPKLSKNAFAKMADEIAINF